MKLRYVLTVLFTLVSSLPVLALGLWVADTAFERERAEVRERHLLLATNITAALERYAKDMSAAFDVMIRTAQARHDFSDIVDLGDRLDFVHFCLIGADGRIEQKHIWADVTIDGISPDLSLIHI